MTTSCSGRTLLHEVA